MNNLQEILIAIRNGDYDHFSETKIAKAREELKTLLKCDDFDLNELLKQFVTFEVETCVMFVGFSQITRRNGE
jgi:hypothetical protein